MLILAEALEEPEAVATALGALGTGYHNLGAYHGGAILLESAAGIAREHHLPFPLARALNNLAAFLNGRDLAAALRHAQECAEVARRAGLEGSVENAMVNYAIGLWCAGRLVELAEIIPDGLGASAAGDGLHLVDPRRLAGRRRGHHPTATTRRARHGRAERPGVANRR